MPTDCAREIINSCERTIGRIRDNARRLGLTYRRGVYYSQGRPFVEREWNEAHKDLKRAKQLYEALTYEAATKALAKAEENKQHLIEQSGELHERRRELLQRFKSQYRYQEGNWVGLTEEDAEELSDITYKCKAISKRKKSVFNDNTEAAARDFIDGYKRRLADGHVAFRGYVPDAVSDLYALDLDRRRGQLAAVAADKIRLHEGVCRMGRDAIGSTWRRLVVDKLPSLASSRDQIQRILSMDPEFIQSVRDSLSQSYHTGCPDPSCAFEAIIRRLGEGVRSSNDDETPTGATGVSSPIPIPNSAGDMDNVEIDPVVERALLRIRFPSGQNSTGEDESTGSNSERGDIAYLPDGISRISRGDSESDDAEETSDDGRSDSGDDLYVPPAATVPQVHSEDVGEGSGCEGTSNTSEDKFFVHESYASVCNGTEVQSGTGVEDSFGKTEGVPTLEQDLECGREVRRDNSGHGNLVTPDRGGEDSASNIGDEPRPALESKRLRHSRVVPVDTNPELVVQSANMKSAKVGKSGKRVSGGNKTKPTTARLLDQIPHRLQGVQTENDSKDSYLWHLGCTDSFRLLPQSVKESIRTRVGYYPAYCSHNVEVTPLHGEDNGKVIGQLLSGNLGYGLIVVSKSKAESLRKGKTITLRGTFGSERLRGAGVRESGEEKRRKQRSKNDTVPYNKVQPDARKVHKADGEAAVQAKGRQRKSGGRKGDEQQDAGSPPVEVVEPGERPSGVVTRPDKVGPTLQPRSNKSDAHVLPNDNPRRRVEGASKPPTRQQGGDDGRDKIPVNGRGNERRHDHSPGELRITCYHCLDTVQGNEARDAWTRVEDDRRRGRFRGRGKQVLCDTCSAENARMVQGHRSRSKNRTRGRHVQSDRILPVKAATAPRDDRDGSQPTQSIGIGVHRGRKKRPPRVLSSAVGNAGGAPSRTASPGAYIPKSKSTLSTREKREDRDRVRSKQGRSDRGGLGGRGK